MFQEMKVQDNAEVAGCVRGGAEWVLLGHGRASRGTGAAVAFPGRDTDAVGGTFGFLSSFQSQPNHESGPPGLKTDVLGLVVACHPAQQQPLPQQEEAQGALRRREHQTEARRVSQSWICCITCIYGAVSRSWCDVGTWLLDFVAFL